MKAIILTTKNRVDALRQIYPNSYLVKGKNMADQLEEIKETKSDIIINGVIDGYNGTNNVEGLVVPVLDVWGQLMDQRLPSDIEYRILVWYRDDISYDASYIPDDSDSDMKLKFAFAEEKVVTCDGVVVQNVSVIAPIKNFPEALNKMMKEVTII